MIVINFVLLFWVALKIFTHQSQSQDNTEVDLSGFLVDY